ncbi:hypothetical protein HQO27_06900 [Rhodococcus fascians]|nr:hypothetical protein [Rhodococcus fascians]MBY4430494.1 hypothetical protein [Rhodococcus fascians]
MPTLNPLMNMTVDLHTCTITAGALTVLFGVDPITHRKAARRSRRLASTLQYDADVADIADIELPDTPAPPNDDRPRRQTSTSSSRDYGHT